VQERENSRTRREGGEIGSRPLPERSRPLRLCLLYNTPAYIRRNSEPRNRISLLSHHVPLKILQNTQMSRMYMHPSIPPPARHHSPHRSPSFHSISTTMAHPPSRDRAATGTTATTLTPPTENGPQVVVPHPRTQLSAVRTDIPSPMASSADARWILTRTIATFSPNALRTTTTPCIQEGMFAASPRATVCKRRPSVLASRTAPLGATETSRFFRRRYCWNQLYPTHTLTSVLSSHLATRQHPSPLTTPNTRSLSRYPTALRGKTAFCYRDSSFRQLVAA
jgi:hypothetical protein